VVRKFLMSQESLQKRTKDANIRLNRNRLHSRPRRLPPLRPLRSPQNTPATPRPLQQPVFHLRLQLPLDGARPALHYRSRGLAGPLLRLQSHAFPRPPFFGTAIRVLGTGAEDREAVVRRRRNRAGAGDFHGGVGGWYGGHYYMSA
jgi:hypothetical protein